jgi:hypothetical protein
MEKGLVLKEMQVLPTALSSIMERLIDRGTDRTAQMLGIAPQVKVNLTLIRFKANRSDLPRGLETQGCRKQQVGVHPLQALNEVDEGLLGYANFHTKRKSAEKTAEAVVALWREIPAIGVPGLSMRVPTALGSWSHNCWNTAISPLMIRIGLVDALTNVCFLWLMGMPHPTSLLRDFQGRHTGIWVGYGIG